MSQVVTQRPHIPMLRVSQDFYSTSLRLDLYYYEEIVIYHTCFLGPSKKDLCLRLWLIGTILVIQFFLKKMSLIWPLSTIGSWRNQRTRRKWKFCKKCSSAQVDLVFVFVSTGSGQAERFQTKRGRSWSSHLSWARLIHQRRAILEQKPEHHLSHP